MLKLMRDSFQHLKWILVAIVAVFILFIFVDWGAGGPRSGRGADDRGYAARVNGQTISMQEFSRNLYFMTKNYEQMYRQPLSPEMIEAMGLNRQVIESLVDQRLLLQEAQRLHLTATADEVQKRILTTPSLNPDGKFIGYDLYQRFVTGQLGFQNVADFEDELSHQITLEKMESALASAVVVSPKAAEAEYRRMSENAKIRYVVYNAAREAATVTVSQPEVAEYYKTNQAKYAHGEQRAVKYLVADVARIRATIVPSDADLRKRYDASHEDYRTKEAAHILHILIKVDPNAPPPVDAAAKAKAEDLVKQLRAGADFAKLAKENSGDPSSSGNGGDMGFIERGLTVEPFENAAFSVPLNAISDPIRTKEYGYHIIKVLARRPEGYRPFEEVRPQLVAQVTDQLAKDHARDEITRISMALKEKKPKSPEQFTAMANDKVSSIDTLWFQENDTIPGLGNNQVLSTWVFSGKEGDIGDIIGTQ
ncbi:MAG TPA: SurA N-terminal domain-containing protein, partial [Thermoanaerobaculia bacterium]|nr:SurA N-terminal domain-containing protein [Thermoanaerobaculia bacterium]